MIAQVRRPICGTCIDKGARTSSQLVTALGNSMMNWEVMVAKTKEHFAFSSLEFR
jgi:hypothetical protein